MCKLYRIYAIALFLALTVTVLSGCTGNTPPPNPPSGNTEDLPPAPPSDGEEEKTEKEAFVGYSLAVPPPAEGTPADYNGIENVSFMAYVLAHQNAYRSEGFGTVDTKVGILSYRQKIETYKDCKNGVMIAVDVAESSLVSTAAQVCYLGDRVLRREPLSKNAKDWNGRNTRFSEDAPAGSSVEEYRKTYGLPSTDFSVYLLNAETLTEWSEVTDNGDGTYTQTVYPNVKTASADYAVRMKTMGGLSDTPVFQQIEITCTFDASWRVLSMVTRERYGVTLGILHADHCSATTTQTFSYDGAAVDISAYDTYFSRYASGN